MKYAVGQLYDPTRGGSYKVFNKRPLRPDILQYYAYDIKVLPSLWDVYSTKLRKPGYGPWRSMIRHKTRCRIKLSQSPHYDGQAKSKVYGLWDEYKVEAQTEDWNDYALLAVRDGKVLYEDDQWVGPPQTNADRSSVLTLATCFSGGHD